MLFLKLFLLRFGEIGFRRLLRLRLFVFIGFTLPFWSGLDDVINQYIDSVTLEQLARSLPSASDGCCGCNSKN